MKVSFVDGTQDQKLDRDFFNIQVEFAKKLAKVSGQPFFDLLRTRTDVYGRLGLGKSLDVNNPIWQEFIADGEEGVAERAYNIYMTPVHESKKREKIWFGCFNPEYNPEKRQYMFILAPRKKQAAHSTTQRRENKS